MSSAEAIVAYIDGGARGNPVRPDSACESRGRTAR